MKNCLQILSGSQSFGLVWGGYQWVQRQIGPLNGIEKCSRLQRGRVGIIVRFSEEVRIKVQALEFLGKVFSGTWYSR